MATTTAAITLTSSDLLSTQALSVSTTNTLYKAGATTGLDQVRMGRNDIPTGTSFNLLDGTAAAIDKSNHVYISNKSTDATYYVTIVIDAKTIGRLYAGDWMYMPWNVDDATHDLEVTATTGTNIIEWMCIHEGETLETQAD
tara:strand:+ start:27 stop:452 length:426 start_codon:yes stop_codon:yes gene_type:complete